MAGDTYWKGPEPPPGMRLCAWHAGVAKGSVATENQDTIKNVPDGKSVTFVITEEIPLAVTQTLVFLPLPQQIPGMPPALPVLVDVCWTCLTGLKRLTSALAIPGSPLVPA